MCQRSVTLLLFVTHVTQLWITSHTVTRLRFFGLCGRFLQPFRSIRLDPRKRRTECCKQLFYNPDLRLSSKVASGTVHVDICSCSSRFPPVRPPFKPPIPARPTSQHSTLLGPGGTSLPAPFKHTECCSRKRARRGLFSIRLGVVQFSRLSCNALYINVDCLL